MLLSELFNKVLYLAFLLSILDTFIVILPCGGYNIVEYIKSIIEGEPEGKLRLLIWMQLVLRNAYLIANILFLEAGMFTLHSLKSRLIAALCFTIIFLYSLSVLGFLKLTTDIGIRVASILNVVMVVVDGLFFFELCFRRYHTRARIVPAEAFEMPPIVQEFD